MDRCNKEPCCMWKTLFRKWRRSKYSCRKRGFCQFPAVTTSTRRSMRHCGGEMNGEGSMLIRSKKAIRFSIDDLCLANSHFEKESTTSFYRSTSEFFTHDRKYEISGQSQSESSLKISSDHVSNEKANDDSQRMDWSAEVTASDDNNGSESSKRGGRFYHMVRRISICTRYSRLDNERKRALNMSASTNTLTSSTSCEEELMDHTGSNDAIVRQERKSSLDSIDGQRMEETSSLDDDDDVMRNACAKLEVLERVLSGLQSSRTTYGFAASRSPLVNRKSVFRSLKDLFSLAQKFEKTPKRGLYIGVLVISREDSVLVTHQNLIPFLLIDENFSRSSLKSNFEWLLKVSCCWENAKNLLNTIDDTCEGIEVVTIRRKILSTIFLLQEMLDLNDLGNLHPEPFFCPSTESVLLLTVKHLGPQDSLRSAQLKWASLRKIRRCLGSSSSSLNNIKDGGNGFDAERIDFQNTEIFNIALKQPGLDANHAPLEPGLYVIFLKLRCSVEYIKVFVPRKFPTMMPYVKVRDCPVVTREEWDSITDSDHGNFRFDSIDESTFRRLVRTASVQLLLDLGVDETAQHRYRLYSSGVIRLNENVTLIALMPPVDQICILPGQEDNTDAFPQYFDIPITAFEIINMNTYQKKFSRRYCKLSTSLEISLLQANQATRQAFNTEDLFFSKQQLHRLEMVKRNLEKVRNEVRWIPDLISFARNRLDGSEVLLEKLFIT